MPRQIYSASHHTLASVLTEENFEPFGTVAQSGGRLSRNAVPANQGTALKIASACATTNSYHLAPSNIPANATTSMFICSPRKLREDPGRRLAAMFDVRILERHPYTSQTFVPLGLDTNEESAACYLVVVCPSLPHLSHSYESSSIPTDWPREGTKQECDLIDRAPDLANIKAFIARGNQAISYAAGTWHAPMIALGVDDIEFIVFQFANGVADEDCQEVEILKRDSGGRGITVFIDWPRTATSHVKGKSRKPKI